MMLNTDRNDVNIVTRIQRDYINLMLNIIRDYIVGKTTEDYINNKDKN